MKFQKITYTMVLILAVLSVSSVFTIETKSNDLNTYLYHPLWEKAVSFNTYIEETTSGIDAHATIISIGNEKIKGRLYLQKYKNDDWSTVKSWRFSSNNEIKLSKSYNTSSGKYRTKLVANIGRNYSSTYSSEYDIK